MGRSIRVVLAVAGVGLVVACCGFASRAQAQSCSGDGGSAGGSSGGSSSGGGSQGGSSDSSAAETVEVCHDTTEITGLEECARFGHGWDLGWMPALRFDLGLEVGELTLDGATFEGIARHDENPYRWALLGSDVAGDSVVTARLRATGFLARGLFGGVELGVGGGSARGGTWRTEELEVQPTGILVLDAGAVGGVAHPVGPVTLRAEVFAGWRGVALHTETRRGDCVATDAAWYGGLVVAPRIGAEWFVTPWVSLDAYGGTHVLGPGGWHGGVGVRVHARSYDGQRDP